MGGWVRSSGCEVDLTEGGREGGREGGAVGTVENRSDSGVAVVVCRFVFVCGCLRVCFFVCLCVRERA